MLDRIEPQDPLLVGGACADFLRNQDNIDCRHICASDGTGEESEDTRKQQAEWKQQQTTTLSEPTSVEIDAIDTDMNPRAGDAELIPWLLVPDCAPLFFFCERSKMLSRWWLVSVYDTDCLQLNASQQLDVAGCLRSVLLCARMRVATVGAPMCWSPD